MAYAYGSSPLKRFFIWLILDDLLVHLSYLSELAEAELHTTLRQKEGALLSLHEAPAETRRETL